MTGRRRSVRLITCVGVNVDLFRTPVRDRTVLFVRKISLGLSCGLCLAGRDNVRAAHNTHERGEGRRRCSRGDIVRKVGSPFISTEVMSSRFSVRFIYSTQDTTRLREVPSSLQPQGGA